ncbi:MAG: methionyl-tRNA formyltransferase [Oscillospiraceae bacterium]
MYLWARRIIAAACLEKLLTEHMNVVAVYTKPDTPQNRGMKLTQSPVKRVALAREIPVYQPAGFREAAAVEELRALKPDVIAVVAYGRILPQVVLICPPKGCDQHPRQPAARSCRAPALCSGRCSGDWKRRGSAAMFMAAEMDAGDMIATERPR